MGMPVILAVMNAHDRPDLLAAQIRNYNAAMNGNVIHAVNINSKLEQQFWHSAKELNIDFQAFGNVMFNTPSVETGYGSILHAYLQTIMHALRQDLKFDYVYFHTPADLLVRRDVDAYISSFDIGFSDAYEYPFDEKHHFTLHHGKDRWVGPMSLNSGLFRFLDSLGHPVAHRVRTEGAFFKRHIFFEVLYPLLLTNGIEYFHKAPEPYPFEETELASCMEFFKKRHMIKRARNLIRVVEDKQVNGIDTDDVVDALKQHDIYGIKRPSNVLDSDVRRYIATLVGE
jgi:hypothetical protein